MFDSYLSESILARGKKEKLIDFAFYNPRDFAKPTVSQKKNDKPYVRIDDKPYGGGPGMVMQALPILKAVEKIMSVIEKDPVKETKKAQAKLSKGIFDTKTKSKVKIIFFTPAGNKLNTDFAKSTAKKFTDIILICGRYEGIDSRIKKILKPEEISVGDYVLTGGELPAMLVIDTISRQIKGVLGDHLSLEEERISSHDMYTRPEILEYKGKKHKVPEVLLSGNHKKIDEWRKTNL